MGFYPGLNRNPGNPEAYGWCGGGGGVATPQAPSHLPGRQFSCPISISAPSGFLFPRCCGVWTPHLGWGIDPTTPVLPIRPKAFPYSPAQLGAQDFLSQGLLGLGVIRSIYFAHISHILCKLRFFLNQKTRISHILCKIGEKILRVFSIFTLRILGIPTYFLLIFCVLLKTFFF